MAADTLVGTTVLGRYQIQGEIGRGSMGVVYKAHDTRLDRVVALKTIRKDRYVDPNDEQDPDLLARFEREAKAAGKLSHPGVVTVYDIGEDGGNVYIAMEFIEGVSLRARMKGDARLPVAEAARLACRICEALDYAHRRGVVHRDVKPDNILCLPDGALKLTDFGVARLSNTNATQTGKPIGTPRYMAPEQWRAEAVDGRADVFAVGVILYELVTGQPPFPAKSTTELMYRVLHDPVPTPSFANPLSPPALDQVVRRALARDPAERFATAAEMATALEPLFLAAVPTDADPTVLASSLADAPTVMAPPKVPVAPSVTPAAPPPQSAPPASEPTEPDATIVRPGPPAPPAPLDGPPARPPSPPPPPTRPVDPTPSARDPERPPGRATAGRVRPARPAAVPRTPPPPGRRSPWGTIATLVAMALLAWWVWPDSRALGPVPNGTPITLLRTATPERVLTPTPPGAQLFVDPPPSADASTTPSAAVSPESSWAQELAALRDPATPDEEKLALVERLAADPGDAATDALAALGRDGPILLSMAGLKALGGRPCERVQGTLVVLLESPDWQRRAWAAKVLGQSDCTGALDALRARRTRETDARVGQNLTAAIGGLEGR